MTKVHISEHFTAKKIFKMTIAPILMALFSSIYSVVDGVYISANVGNAAFSGVNLIMPILMIIGSVGWMFGTGGTALVSKYLGEKNKEGASRVFSTMVYLSIISGIVLSLVFFFLIDPITRAMASISSDNTEEMIEYAILYGKIIVCGETLFIMQNAFQALLAADEKQKVAFFFTLAAGLSNIVLDALFIIVFKMGVAGAAIATIIGYAIGGIGPIIYYLFFHKDGEVRLIKTKFSIREVLQCMWNGCSEFVSNISSSVVSIVFNIQLLRIYGQNGVAAYGTVMYVSYFFIAIFFGYNIGMSPVIGYNYGAKNKDEMTNVLNRSLIFVAVSGFLMSLFAFATATVFGNLFSGGDQKLDDLIVLAMRCYSASFMLAGFSIYLSSFFTSLNDGLISALISLIRTLVLQIATVLLLPLIFNDSSIWFSGLAAEIGSIVLSFIFLLTLRKKYGYWEKKDKTSKIEETSSN